ncbi:MAG: hypothetical protein WAV50_00900 [Minisyncoccia bacterium]
MLNKVPVPIPRQVDRNPLLETLEGATKKYQLRDSSISNEVIARHLGLWQGVRPSASYCLFDWNFHEIIVVVRKNPSELHVGLMHWRDLHDKLVQIADEVVDQESEETRL